MSVRVMSVFAGVCAVSLAPGAEVTPLVLSGQAMPATSGIGGVFEAFEVPAFDGEHVAFIGRGGAGEGIFSTAGGLHAVVDRSMALPGLGEVARTFGMPVIDRGRTVATAWGETGGGVYTRDPGGELQTMADVRTTIPGGVGTFTGISGASTRGGVVVFQGSGAGGQRGVYRSGGGPLERIVDRGSFAPGLGDAFTLVDGPDVRGDRVVFRGVTPTGEGVYEWNQGALGVIADTTMMFPGAGHDHGGGGGDHESPFGFFVAPTAGEEHAAFLGFDHHSEGGIFLVEHGEVHLIMSEHTLVPGGLGGEFLGFFDAPSIDGETVAFLGFGSGGEMGIFAGTHEDGVFPVVMRGERVGDRVIEDLRIGPHGMRDGRLAFWAQFQDGGSGLFLTTVPTPGTAVLPGVALSLACLRRRRAGSDGLIGSDV